MHTPWGYQVESLPPLIDEYSFGQATAGRWDCDPRVEAAIAAASAAVRNECGWHVAPSLECSARLTAEGRLCRIPAGLVTAVSAVREEGAECSQFEARSDGLLRRTAFRSWTPAWEGVEVEYTAGYDLEAVPDLVQAVASVAEAALAVPSGVSSESAGGVSVSYSVQASSVAASMAAQLRGALAPYRVVGSHAA